MRIDQEIAAYKQAIKNGMSDLEILMSLGDSSILDLAHSEIAQEVLIASDPAVRQHELMIQECFATDPWSLLIEEAEAEEANITPAIDPLVLVNVKNYNGFRWIATGTEGNVKLTAKELATNPGLLVRTRRNGKDSAKGSWLMIIEELFDRVVTAKIAA